MNVIPHWNRLLVVAVVAVLSAATVNTAQADLVLSGSTFYSYDFEDVLVVGSHPASSTGEVTWTGLGQSSRTRVNLDPTGATNQTLRSQPNTSSSNTAQRAVFSTTMQTGLPADGTVDFRLYLDDLSAGNTASVFRVMKDAVGPVSTSNTLFGVTASGADGLEFISDGTTFDLRSAVLDEWIDVSIDYSLDNAANNLKVTLNSTTIADESFTFTKDLTGLTTNGFYIYNFGSGAGDNVFHIDDINWQGAVAAVPEPSSFAFFSLVGLLATRKRRKKSV